MATEAKELYDRAKEAESSGVAVGSTEVNSPEELAELAKSAAANGNLLIVNPHLILAILGEKAELGDDQAESDGEESSGDERTREPEREGEGPTSQPGPAQEPGGPSTTEGHPEGAPDAP